MKKVIVLCVIVLAAFVLYGCSEENVSKSEAKLQAKQIAKAAVKFKKDYERPVMDVEELASTKYVVINESVKDQWEFEIEWPDRVVAYSLEKMPGGEGETIIIDIKE